MKQTKYKPKIGDYGVVKTKGWMGLLIRIGTTSRWNHTFIYVGDGLIVEANPTGVASNPVEIYDCIAWNMHENLTDKQRKKIADHAVAQIGEPYDFLNILGLALRILGFKVFGNLLLKKMADSQGYICSELVAEAYQSAGVVLVCKEDYLTVPGDLAERLIWQ